MFLIPCWTQKSLPWKLAEKKNWWCQHHLIRIPPYKTHKILPLVTNIYWCIHLYGISHNGFSSFRIRNERDTRITNHANLFHIADSFMGEWPRVLAPLARSWPWQWRISPLLQTNKQICKQTWISGPPPPPKKKKKKRKSLHCSALCTLVVVSLMVQQQLCFSAIAFGLACLLDSSTKISRNPA